MLIPIYHRYFSNPIYPKLNNSLNIKFSKQLNSVILDSYSQDNIPQADIEEFERRAKAQYELNSFKIKE